MISIEKDDLRLWTSIKCPIRFCRKDGTVLEYEYNIFKMRNSEQEIIVIDARGEKLSPVNWGESDMFLFRYYLEEKYESLPIYCDISDKEKEYYVAYSD